MGIRDFVMAQPLFDAHEHLVSIPEAARYKWSLADLSGYALADLESVAGPRRPTDPPPVAADSPEYPAWYFSQWARTRNTAYCRAVERASRDLFGVEWRLENLPALRRKIEELILPDVPRWYAETLSKNAGIAWAIKDNICLPQEAADGLYPPCVRFAHRDQEMLLLRNREVVARRERQWGRSIHTLDQLVAAWMESISACLATGKVTCFKIGVAYYRSLEFANATHADAERAFNRLMTLEPGPINDYSELLLRQPCCGGEELLPLHDYLTHAYIRRATEESKPIQIHTGYLASNWLDLRNINPIQLVPLFTRYRGARFDLFHSGWPYQEVMATLGKHYPNVWVNMCWSWAMAASSMERALDLFLDAVPYHKIFAFGADTMTPFAAYGYAMQAREGIARVLEARIVRGDMDEPFARDVARRIMLDNGVEFHGLK